MTIFEYSEIEMAFDEYIDRCKAEGVEPEYTDAIEWWENLE